MSVTEPFWIKAVRLEARIRGLQDALLIVARLDRPDEPPLSVVTGYIQNLIGKLESDL